MTGPALDGIDNLVEEGQDNSGSNFTAMVNETIDNVNKTCYYLSMTDTNNIVAALDTKIHELENEALELQRYIQRLTTVNMNLNALRQTRELYAGTETANTPSGNGKPPMPKEAPSRIVPGSIGALALDAIREAGRPMHVKELLDSVHAKGKPDVAMATLVSTLCNYLSSGKVKRPAPSTYALASGG